MALVEFGGGSRRESLFIPKDSRGQGWCRLAEAL